MKKHIEELILILENTEGIQIPGDAIVDLRMWGYERMFSQNIGFFDIYKNVIFKIDLKKMNGAKLCLFDEPLITSVEEIVERLINFKDITKLNINRKSKQPLSVYVDFEGDCINELQKVDIKDDILTITISRDSL